MPDLLGLVTYGTFFLVFAGIFATIALGLNQAATDPNILATRALEAILASQGR